MRALLEFKQKIKNLYSKYELYLMPIIKFGIAMAYFYWINQNMGYMARLNNIFVLVILALISSIMPPVVMTFAGFILMVGHAYGLCIEAAAFMLVLILLLAILFLRFSGGQSIVLVCTPLSFMMDVPVLLPIGSGLLGNALTAFPAGCGVIFYYFIRQLRNQAEALQQLSEGEQAFLAKIKLMADGLIQNWAMWLTVIAFVVVILMVNLIRTRSFDYAWRIAIIAGGIVYVLVMFIGSFYLEVRLSVTPLAVQTIISVVVGLIMEFFFFGGDYSRTERLEYEDDEYYYYVKAVPKAAVATSERSVKRITGHGKEDRRSEEVVSYEKSRSRGSSKKTKKRTSEMSAPVQAPADVEKIDFEKKLEESLKDL